MRTRLPVVAAVVGSCLLPTAAPAAVTEFDVPVGRSVSDQRAFTFEGKTTYTITVSGTLTWTYGLNTKIYDAAYSKQEPSDWVQDGSALQLTSAGSDQAGQSVAEKHRAFHPYPAFSEDHTYTFTVAPASETQTLAFWAWPQGQINPSYSEYSGGFHVKIEGPDPDDGCTAPRVAQASCPAPGLTVSGIKGKVEIQRGGAGWVFLKEGETLMEGDRIHTGWKSTVTLRRSGGGTVTIQPMSLVAVDNTTLGAERFLLRLGEVKAQIHKLGGSSGDFVVKTPTTTASIRGTTFSVRYDGARTLVSVKEGVVAVAPESGGGAVDVGAGREVISTKSKVSQPVAIGRAGAPKGSVGPAKAAAVLTRALAKGFAACRVDVARTNDSFALKAIKRGWRATLKIVGARKGRAVWTIKGKTRVKPRNGLAKKISRRCS